MNRLACKWLALAAGLALLCGCNKIAEVATESMKQAQTAAQWDQMRSDLKELGLAYHNYLDAHNQAPQSWDDLASTGSSEGIARLRNSDLNVRWGVHPRDATIGTSHYVLAYEPQALESGGIVLLLDGSARHMEAEQLGFAVDLREGRLGQEYAVDIFGYYDEFAAEKLRSASRASAGPQHVPPSSHVAGGTAAGSGSDDDYVTLERSAPPDFQPYDFTPPNPQPEAAPELTIAESTEAQPLDRDLLPIEDEPSAVTSLPSMEHKSLEAAGGMRVWTDATGDHQVEAEMIRLSEGKVTLRRRDGREITVPVDRLTEADRQYIANRVQQRRSQTVSEGQTELVGGQGGGSFRSVSTRPMSGVKYSMGRWADQPRLSRLEPIYNPLQANTPNAVMARRGYVVGAIEVDADNYVNAVRVVFMRQNTDGSVDPSDSYMSDWLGEPTGQPVRRLDGHGRPVVGFYGRQTVVLDAIGLILG